VITALAALEIPKKIENGFNTNFDCSKRKNSIASESSSSIQNYMYYCEGFLAS